jgi:hypothetical protein
MSTRTMTIETTDGREIAATVHYDYEPPSRAPDGMLRGSVWIYRVEYEGAEVYLSDAGKCKLEDVIYQMERQNDR